MLIIIILKYQSGNSTKLLAANLINSIFRQFFIDSGNVVSLFPANIHFFKFVNEPIDDGNVSISLSVNINHSIDEVKHVSEISLSLLLLNET